MKTSLLAIVGLLMGFFDSIAEKIFKKPRPDRSNMVSLRDYTLFAGILSAVIFTAIGIVFLIFGYVTMWFLSGAFFYLRFLEWLSLSLISTVALPSAIRISRIKDSLA